jgi:hypothetical protein
MAYFARVDNGTVTSVIAVSNDDAPDPAPEHSEPLGQQFIASLGLDGDWTQTSFNANFRKHFAGVGFAYDVTLDAFVPPRPYPSWTLDEDTCIWVAPVPVPDGDGDWVWDEATLSWAELPDLEAP